ncbi:M23 family metallopeptidase [Vulgatibacter sp.]|uniref:M23 family metallopeptidase n=1 Tax=Vulgatibacter sp. TaxID=1971226 RepID=UPI003562F7B6
MANRTYTLMVIPDRDSHTRRYRVQTRWLVRGGVALGLVLLALAGAGIHYASVLDRLGENRLLRDENTQLRTQLRLVQEKIVHIDETLDRVERFDQKLRAITALDDTERGLPIGPVDGPQGEEEPGAEQAGIGGNEPDEAIDDRLESLVEEAARNERSLAELHRYFEDQRSLLASTPSVWPARGWVTSDFGLRVDPYTAERVMHRGMDIANRPGTPVIAPADGVVVYAGVEGGYGKVLVVDHGYGVKTRYGHLADFAVRLGERVKRGQKLGGVGNTGRSTGPHLHYEVRVNGIPENPRKFLLE